jgi:hypothetical protein
MKALLVLLAAAALGLGWIVLRTPEPSYVAPTPQEVAAHQPAPRTLSSSVPAGFRIQSFAVDGMCCTGCTGKLYARLKAEPGVLGAAVDFEAGLAQAIVPETSDPHALEHVLTFDKYTAKLRP